jgi:hypothetical protein
MMLDKLFTSLMGLAVCVFFTGCGPDADHDAAGDHGHDHAGAEGDAAAPGHDHPEEGPHGGHLIELGEGAYHAELAHDEATHTVTVYLLDADGRSPIGADDREITLQLFQGGRFVDYMLAAAEGASTFSLVDEKLCDTLLHADETRGRLRVAIDGKQQTGTIEHHAHAHEGHEQGHSNHAGHGHDDAGRSHEPGDGHGHHDDHAP